MNFLFPIQLSHFGSRADKVTLMMIGNTVIEFWCPPGNVSVRLHIYVNGWYKYIHKDIEKLLSGSATCNNKFLCYMTVLLSCFK